MGLAEALLHRACTEAWCTNWRKSARENRGWVGPVCVRSLCARPLCSAPRGTWWLALPLCESDSLPLPPIDLVVVTYCTIGGEPTGRGCAAFEPAKGENSIFHMRLVGMRSKWYENPHVRTSVVWKMEYGAMSNEAGWCDCAYHVGVFLTPVMPDPGKVTPDKYNATILPANAHRKDAISRPWPQSDA